MHKYYSYFSFRSNGRTEGVVTFSFRRLPSPSVDGRYANLEISSVIADSFRPSVKSYKCHKTGGNTHTRTRTQPYHLIRGIYSSFTELRKETKSEEL